MNPARTYDRIPNRLVLVCSEKLRFPSRTTDKKFAEKLPYAFTEVTRPRVMYQRGRCIDFFLYEYIHIIQQVAEIILLVNDL